MVRMAGTPTPSADCYVKNGSRKANSRRASVGIIGRGGNDIIVLLFKVPLKLRYNGTGISVRIGFDSGYFCRNEVN